MKRLRLVALALLLAAVAAGLVSMVAQWWLSGEPAAPTAEVGTAERVRVEVLNASGVPGLARTATDRLRDSGFDVVYFGNGRGFGPDSSMVLDRVGKQPLAADVARALDIAVVASRPDSSLYLEVTVVLGRDWAGAAGTSPPPARAPEE